MNITKLSGRKKLLMIKAEMHNKDKKANNLAYTFY